MSSKPLTEDWRSWLRLNLARGCSRPELYNRCVIKEGFDKEAVEQALGYNSSNGGAGTSGTSTSSGARGGGTNSDSKQETGAETPTALSPSSSPHNDNQHHQQQLDNGWKEWIKVRLDQGASQEELFLHCLQEGLNLDQISQALGGYRARCCYESTPPLGGRPSFTKRAYAPRAWRLDTALVDIYEIPNFLTSQECRDVMDEIDAGILERSVVTQQGSADTRTSRTCHLRIEREDDIVAKIEQKLQAMMKMDGNDMNDNNHVQDNKNSKDRNTMQKDPSTCAETLQGQLYTVGDFFKAHTDWFAPDTDEYDKHCVRHGGQRTWTVMVYLNDVAEGGGGTKFIHLEREFIPRQGMALVWNNLDADGKTPNPWTLHEATPVTKGKKYVLTKWFRERSMVD